MHPSRLRTTPLAALVVVLVLLLAPGTAGAADYRAPFPVDGTDIVKALPVPFQVFEAGVPGGPLAADLPQHDGRDPDLVLTLYDMSGDPAHGGPYQVPFWKEGTGLHSDVYIAWNDLTQPTAPPEECAILAEQVQYIADEFDARIWESDVFHFGNYRPRPADDPDGDRAAIMVYNIRDQAYWDAEFPWYIIGFFNGSLNEELQANLVFVDSWDWANSIGADAAYPYAIEATVAHEFTHLIDSDVDGDEDSFVDEGFAMMAEQFLYGDETAPYIGEALFYHRDSVTDWDGELYDYGNVLLWQEYLYERAGGGRLDVPVDLRVKPGYDKFAETPDKFVDPGDAFLWNEAHDLANGLEGIADQVGGMAQVEALHRDWTLANLLDGRVTEPQWNYRNYALGGSDSAGISIADGIDFYNSRVRGNMPPTRKNVWRRTPSEPWGAYYRSYAGQEPGLTASFTGASQDGVLAHSEPYQWYSSLGNMLERTLVRQVDGVMPGDALSFWTWYDIEADWDYGYIEASSDGGATWTQLAQTSALPAGATDFNGSSAWDGPGGLTGNSGGWQEAAYDLAGMSGTVWIRWRYNTDEAVNGLGWFVDDLTVGGVSDAVTDAGAWTTNGWIFTTGLQDNDWTADVYVPYAKARKRAYAVRSLVGLDSADFTGSLWVNTQYSKSLKVIAVVSNRPDGVFSATGVLTIRKGR